MCAVLIARLTLVLCLFAQPIVALGGAAAPCDKVDRRGDRMGDRSLPAVAGCCCRPLSCCDKTDTGRDARDHETVSVCACPAGDSRGPTAPAVPVDESHAGWLILAPAAPAVAIDPASASCSRIGFRSQRRGSDTHNQVQARLGIWRT